MTDQQPDPAGQAPVPLTPELVSAILRDPDNPYYPSRITVFCDDCGVEETGEYMVREDMTRDERYGVARKHLVDTKGWSCTPGPDDICPTCAARPACAKCRLPFNPEDQRFDGHARDRDTPYCRGCVTRCHDTEVADHRCVICA